MSDGNGREPVPAPDDMVLEFGRYKVLRHPGGNGFIIARAINTCDRCQACGCGEQYGNLDISPRGVADLLGQARKAGILKLPFPLGRTP